MSLVFSYFLWLEPTAMRSGATRKGADSTTTYGFLGDLPNAADAELLLHVIQQRADLLHGLLDALLLGFQGLGPEAQCLGAGLDLGGVGRSVFHDAWDHAVPFLFYRAGFLRRTDSNRHTPADTETLRLSTSPLMGIRTRK